MAKSRCEGLKLESEVDGTEDFASDLNPRQHPLLLPNVEHALNGSGGTLSHLWVHVHHVLTQLH